MTELMGVKDTARWISTVGLEKIIPELVQYIEDDFKRWNEFDKSPRVANHTPLGVIELMPTCDSELYGFKYVNGHPSNPSHGYQTVVAFGVLANVHNGYPTFLSEMTLLTAARTAATSAMVARLLARPNSQNHTIIGAGSQSEFQAIAMRSILGLKEITIYDTDPDAITKFVNNLTPLGFNIKVANNAAEACLNADIVTTCTADKTNAQIIKAGDLQPGTHLNAIGGDCPGKTELDPKILDEGPVFVEYLPQTRIEGELQSKDPNYPATELWEVLNKKAPGRTNDKQITIYDSVGFAIEDFSVLRYARDQVQGTNYVTPIDLIAEPEDPKNLFSMITVLSPTRS